MRRLTFALTVATALGMSGAVMAQGYTGWYLGARGGATWLDDTTATISGAATRFEFESGYNIGGHVGYDFGAFRLEAEIVYRDNDIDSIRSGGVLLPGATGNLNSLAGMLNAYYDIELGWPLVPYIGVGIGYGRFTADGINAGGGSPASGLNDEDDRFAYQAMAGLSYWITPAVALSVDYRYFAAEDLDFRLAGGVPVGLEYKTHNVTVGLTLRFPEPARMAPMPVAAPPPPPPPAVAPPPPPMAPKTYLVFFDFDKSDITPEAASIIRQAAVDARTQNVRLIVATGHADRSGPTGYNQRLSERRANAVKSALVREGVAAGIIQTAGRGENENLVATADGVREPRNRRVEIVFR
jgi:OOP family OmpA-OmpF porin